MSLHSTIDATRKLMFGFIFTVCGIFLLMIFIQIGVAIKNRLYPPPPVKPTVAFGKLPDTNFPQSPFNTTNFTYLLNTTTGELPSLPDKETVYQLAQPQASLLALNNIGQLLQKLNYPNQPQQITEELYKWALPTAPFNEITFNTYTLDFDLTSQYLTSPDVIAATNLQDTTNAMILSKQFLIQLESFPSDIDESKTQTSLFSINGSTLIPATSLSQSQIIRVDYYQKDIDKLTVYYPHPPYSTISVFIGSVGGSPQIVEAHYYYKKPTATHATYPIKTAKQAYKELQSGKAYIAGYSGTTQTITIREVDLGYYISDQSQSYLMPIIVFKGDNGFYAYVNAIPDGWISK